MNLDATFPFICGYEDRGDHIRLYVDGPSPKASFVREVGVAAPLFRIAAGADALTVRVWLNRNPAWQSLRVPTYTREKGVRAVVLARGWNPGDGSALHALARGRVIRDEEHRRRLRGEVRGLIQMVLANPVGDGELAELQVIEDVVNAGPVGVELCTAAEVFAACIRGR